MPRCLAVWPIWSCFLARPVQPSITSAQLFRKTYVRDCVLVWRRRHMQKGPINQKIWGGDCGLGKKIGAWHWLTVKPDARTLLPVSRSPGTCQLASLDKVKEEKPSQIPRKKYRENVRRRQKPVKRRSWGPWCVQVRFLGFFLCRNEVSRLVFSGFIAKLNSIRIDDRPRHSRTLEKENIFLYMYLYGNLN